MVKRFTKEQKEAIRQYWLKIASQDNYLASVFVNEGSTGYHARLVAEAADDLRVDRGFLAVGRGDVARGGDLGLSHDVCFSCEGASPSPAVSCPAMRSHRRSSSSRGRTYRPPPVFLGCVSTGASAGTGRSARSPRSGRVA